MTFELQMLLATTAILFVLLAVQGVLVPINHGFGWGLGSRDEPRTPSPLQRRVARTIANHMEGMALFAPLVIVVHLTGLSSELTVWGSAVYVIGRAGFAAFYLGGVPIWRSLAWGISVTGLALVAAPLAAGI